MCSLKFVSQNLCDDSSAHSKPISSTHTGHYSGIEMSGDMTSAITERISGLVIPGSNNKYLNDTLQGEKGIPQ